MEGERQPHSGHVTQMGESRPASGEIRVRVPAGPPHDERDRLRKLVARYIDNHCTNADAEGASTACDCTLCRDARTELGLST